ncbi:hypothetical protein LY78DRAFT_4053 [Colletotrichum sublineola]|nr:hypothetical protein LY78DRAFT_4053 [Colletotrichum sublineola]
METFPSTFLCYGTLQVLYGYSTYLPAQKAPGPRSLAPPVFIKILTDLPRHSFHLVLLYLFHGFGGPSKSLEEESERQYWLLGDPERPTVQHDTPPRWLAGDVRLIPSLGLAWARPGLGFGDACLVPSARGDGNLPVARGVPGRPGSEEPGTRGRWAWQAYHNMA